jgi:hypothetical protein
MITGHYRNAFGESSGPAPSWEDIGALGDWVANPEVWGGPSDPFGSHSNESTVTAMNVIAAGNGNSQTPAGYTYLGQFIGHDISFDSKSDRNDPAHRPEHPTSTLDVRNHRTPLFDLETVYGNTSPTRPGEPARERLIDPSDRDKLRLDPTVRQAGADVSFPNDLPRNPDAVVDPRNAENLIIAQIQTAFAKFHNAMVDRLRGNGRTADVFECARRLVIRHYQKVVIDDFLPRFVHADTLAKVLAKIADGSPSFYTPAAGDLYLPREFSVGAFRLFHALIQNGYNINRLHPQSIMPDLFERAGSRLGSSWVVNWNLFFDTAGRSTGFNFAKRIDHRFSSLLSRLPTRLPGPRLSLAVLDLARGSSSRLRSGQEIADEMRSHYDLRTVAPSEIGARMTAPLFRIFGDRTPLLFYLLVESDVHNAGEQAGDLGGVLIAETFFRLLKLSPYSVLDSPLGDDDEVLVPSRNGTELSVPDILNFIAAGNQLFDELNPLGDHNQP